MQNSADAQYQEQPNASFLQPVEIDGELCIEVECGENKGTLFLPRLCQGSKGPCILFEDSFLTPNEFQYVSGRETAKDWKRSIRHKGKSMKLLITRGCLNVHRPTCECDGCRISSPVNRGRLSEKRMVLNDKDKQSSIPYSGLNVLNHKIQANMRNATKREFRLKCIIDQLRESKERQLSYDCDESVVKREMIDTCDEHVSSIDERVSYDKKPKFLGRSYSLPNNRESCLPVDLASRNLQNRGLIDINAIGNTYSQNEDDSFQNTHIVHFEYYGPNVGPTGLPFQELYAHVELDRQETSNDPRHRSIYTSNVKQEPEHFDHNPCNSHRRRTITRRHHRLPYSVRHFTHESAYEAQPLDLSRNGKSQKYSKIGEPHQHLQHSCDTNKFLMSRVKSWSVEQVARFIGSLDGFEDSVQIFREHHIDGNSLSLLTVDHMLNNLGIKLGPALNLVMFIAKATGRCERCMHCVHCHDNRKLVQHFSNTVL